MRGPLTGKIILVTRPRETADALAEDLRKQGATVLLIPAMVIAPLPDTGALQAAHARLSCFDYAAFVSANAVRLGLQGLASWPPQLVALAPGPGTAQSLREHGAVRVLSPAERFDSEGMLALPELQELTGRRVLIFRGEGGRELLAEALRTRGAEVELLTCYRRLPPRKELPALASALLSGGLDAAVITSSEGLLNLMRDLPPLAAAALRDLPLFVPHPRIAARAEAQGCRRVITTGGADAGLTRGLLSYFATHEPKD